MAVLIACEESQAVCIEFRKLGVEAYSCDILPCSGGHPEWHLQTDVLNILNNSWDAIIAFPPCTYLTVTANKWMKPEYKHRFPNRHKHRQEAIDFFLQVANANSEFIAIENPVGVISSVYRKPDQIINPYYFGDPVPKKTCLWLKKLPPLIHTKQPTLFEPQSTHVEPEFVIGKRDGKKYSKIHYETPSLDPEERRKIRSKTFPGIAKAMAEQWSKVINQSITKSNNQNGTKI